MSCADCRNTALAVSVLTKRIERLEGAILTLARVMEPKEPPPDPTNRQLLERIDGGVVRLLDRKGLNGG